MGAGNVLKFCTFFGVNVTPLMIKVEFLGTGINQHSTKKYWRYMYARLTNVNF